MHRVYLFPVVTKSNNVIYRKKKLVFAIRHLILFKLICPKLALNFYTQLSLGTLNIAIYKLDGTIPTTIKCN